MKPYFLAALFVLSLSIHAQAQVFEPVAKEGLIVIEKPQPLVLVNEQQTTTSALILNPNDIKNVEVVKGTQALERFGEKATDGAVLIDLKQDLPLARVEEVYKAFSVPHEQQQLTIAINGNHVKDPALLLADLCQIEQVELADFETAPSRWSYDAQYLNIVTKPQP
ncbi:hypothetical protein [Pontibacter litorisediminis]|uniref:hypothetical protein n=1 Tax=Pontibacter litorisediminis TaxID=1846260 RepID=UPI0023ED09FA|nr:hypothetical protein [Pontibacter litorisediminis]